MEISIKEIRNAPNIEKGADLPKIVVQTIKSEGIELFSNDILCIASKVVSISENRDIELADVKASETALSIQRLIPKKDPRIIQLMINETGDPTGSRLFITGDHHIAGWLQNGLRLTSAGIDKMGPEMVALLPEDSDRSARQIGESVLRATGINVGVIITDSEGREDKKGSSQIAIGVYGVPALRSKNGVEETLCDMLAASAAIIMGQRGNNKPFALIQGVDYVFDKESSIKDALYDEHNL